MPLPSQRLQAGKLTEGQQECRTITDSASQPEQLFKIISALNQPAFLKRARLFLGGGEQRGKKQSSMKQNVSPEEVVSGINMLPHIQHGIVTNRFSSTSSPPPPLKNKGGFEGEKLKTQHDWNKIFNVKKLYARNLYVILLHKISNDQIQMSSNNAQHQNSGIAIFLIFPVANPCQELSSEE